MPEEKPELKNKLLEFELRHQLSERLADHVIKNLGQKEYHPEERPLIGLKAIAKYAGWKYEQARKLSRELQDAEVAFKQSFFIGNQRRRMVCAYPSDLKKYLKRRQTPLKDILHKRKNR